MRKVLSLSLDAKTISQVKKQSRQAGFDNVSQYMRHLLAAQDDIITEDELALELKAAKQEYAAGKTIQARSLADFL